MRFHEGLRQYALLHSEHLNTHDPYGRKWNRSADNAWRVESNGREIWYSDVKQTPETEQALQRKFTLAWAAQNPTATEEIADAMRECKAWESEPEVRSETLAAIAQSIREAWAEAEEEGKCPNCKADNFDRTRVLCRDCGQGHHTSKFEFESEGYEVESSLYASSTLAGHDYLFAEVDIDGHTVKGDDGKTNMVTEDAYLQILASNERKAELIT